MGYNLTMHSFRRNKAQLDQMLKHKMTLRFPTSNPKRLAYKLREAIRAAGEFEETRHYFDALSKTYQFHEHHGYIIAEYVGIGEPESIGEPIEEIPLPKAPVQKTASQKPLQAPPKKTVPDATVIIDVMAVAMSLEHEEEIYFPNVVVVDSDKIKIYNWANDLGWKYLDHEDRGITLTKKEIPDDILWSPPK